MQTIATIGLDIAKSVFQVHGIDAAGQVVKVLGIKSDEVIFVSSNSFDVTGAKHFGFKVAWVRRDGSADRPADPVSPAQMYRLLRGNAETLGYMPDHTVSSLTELPSLL